MNCMNIIGNLLNNKNDIRGGGKTMQPMSKRSQYNTNQNQLQQKIYEQGLSIMKGWYEHE